MRKSKSKEIQRKCPSNLNEFYQWVDAQNYSERDLLLIYEQPADTKTDEVCDLIEKAENICDYRVAAELRKKYNFLFEEKANKIVEDQNIQKHVNTFTSDPKHAEFMRFLCYAPNKKVETNLDFLTLYFNSQKRKNHFTSTFNVISEFEKQSVKDFSTDLFVKKYLQIRNRKKNQGLEKQMSKIIINAIKRNQLTQEDKNVSQRDKTKDELEDSKDESE